MAAEVFREIFVQKLRQSIQKSRTLIYKQFTINCQAVGVSVDSVKFTVEDLGDLNNKSISLLLSSFMPIFRLTPNSYLIGAESKRMEVRGKNCTIRVGGGYVSL